MTFCNGRNTLYNKAHAIDKSITRAECMDFLRSQKIYQLHTHVKKTPRDIKQPTIKKPAQLFQMDTTHMTEFGGKKIILCVIDYVTKYAFVRSMTENTMANVCKAFKSIMDEDLMTSTPAVVQTDNGGEFGGEFTSMLKDMGIKHIKTQPHMPYQNAIIERFNRTIKSKLSQLMTNSGDKN